MYKLCNMQCPQQYCMKDNLFIVKLQFFSSSLYFCTFEIYFGHVRLHVYFCQVCEPQILKLYVVSNREAASRNKLSGMFCRKVC